MGGNNKASLVAYGYTFTGFGKKVHIDPNHLNKTSKQKVKFKCDTCGTIYHQEKGPGVCLASYLHKKLHSLYGYKNIITTEQFEQFVSLFNTGQLFPSTQGSIT